jgi:hypothetical protein
MKIAFLSSIYPVHAEQIYRENPSLKDKSSYEQIEFIRWHALSSYVKWDDYLKNNGYDVFRFHHNLNFVEKKWAKENLTNLSHKTTVFEIGLEKIKRFKPDIIYCSSPHAYIQNGFLEELINSLSRRPKIVAWYGANCGDEKIFNFFDLTLTNSKHLASSLIKRNIKADLLQHSFDPVILDKINLQVKRINRVAFFGNLDTSTYDFHERTKLLHEVSEKTRKFDVFGKFEKPKLNHRAKYFGISMRHSFSKKAFKILPLTKFNYWSKNENLPSSPWPIEKKFSRFVKLPFYGHEMLEKLSGYQVAFNYHNKHTGDTACNMRLFEATGVGCCLLTDHKSDLNDLFEPDAEVVTYKSTEEAVSKAKYLTQNPQIAKEIGVSGQHKTLSTHTAEKQIEKLVFHLKNLFDE